MAYSLHGLGRRGFTIGVSAYQSCDCVLPPRIHGRRKEAQHNQQRESPKNTKWRDEGFLGVFSGEFRYFEELIRNGQHFRTLTTCSTRRHIPWILGVSSRALFITNQIVSTITPRSNPCWSGGHTIVMRLLRRTSNPRSLNVKVR